MLEIVKCLMLGVLTGAYVGVGRELCLGALLWQTLANFLATEACLAEGRALGSACWVSCDPTSWVYGCW